MEGATPNRKRLVAGSKIAGTVSRVGKDTVFVDIGAKSEGQIDRGEVPEAKVGDSLQAFIVVDDEQGTVLSVSLSGAAAADHLEDAQRTQTPVEGKVTARNSGGFEVRIGTVRAFCPVSRISRIPEVDLDAYVGQTLSFRVIETGDKIVVDRRVLQEEEAAEKAAAMWETLAVGQQHRGIVRSVQPFGMFVDLGGVEGLVPKREISWGVVDDPRTVVRPGAAVEVAILEMDPDRRRADPVRPRPRGRSLDRRRSVLPRGRRLPGRRRAHRALRRLRRARPRPDGPRPRQQARRIDARGGRRHRRAAADDRPRSAPPRAVPVRKARPRSPRGARPGCAGRWPTCCATAS